MMNNNASGIMKSSWPARGFTAKLEVFVASINGVVISFPDIHVFGLGISVFLLVSVYFNFIYYLYAEGKFDFNNKKARLWFLIAVLLVVYVGLRTLMGFAVNYPFTVGDYGAASAAKIARGVMIMLIYPVSLWPLLSSPNRKKIIIAIIRTWLILNLGYGVTELLHGGAYNGIFHTQMVQADAGRIRLLGYEPSYSGSMLVLMIVLLALQKPIRIFDKFLIYISPLFFVAIFSKAAVMAILAASLLVFILRPGKIITRAFQYKVRTIFVVAAVVFGLVYVMNSASFSSNFSSNVTQPFYNGINGAVSYAVDAGYQGGSFATRFLASLDALKTVFPSHFVFGYGVGLAQFAMYTTAENYGLLSGELLSYAQSNLGAFTAKSVMGNMLLYGGLVEVFLFVYLAILSFNNKINKSSYKYGELRIWFICILLMSLFLTERIPFLLILILLLFTGQNNSGMVEKRAVAD